MRKSIYGLLILVIQFFTIGMLEAQNLVGMEKDDIMDEMNTRYKGFRLNTSAVNHVYKYLKYEDDINQITILFFLSDDNKCTMVREMYDYSNINDVLKELNTSYKQDGKNHWSDSKNGKNYDIELTEGDWFFTVTIKPKE